MLTVITTAGRGECAPSAARPLRRGATVEDVERQLREMDMDLEALPSKFMNEVHERAARRRERGLRMLPPAEGGTGRKRKGQVTQSSYGHEVGARCSVLHTDR